MVAARLIEPTSKARPPGVRGPSPILGVCLGHQAIGAAYGARVKTAAHIVHKKTGRVSHDGRGLFSNAEQRIEVVRYHSLIVDQASLPDQVIVTARSLDDGCITNLRHRHFPIEIGTVPSGKCWLDFRPTYASILYRNIRRAPTTGIRTGLISTPRDLQFQLVDRYQFVCRSLWVRFDEQGLGSQW